ncbi:MAG: polysaccharide deacetylase family protein [Alphaproteobacteria bacterium]
MTYLPRLDATPSAAPLSGAGRAAADWPELMAEFDRWSEAGRVARLWWRDDDAAAATPELVDLLRIAGRTPLALAVIPAFATADLAALLHDAPAVAVLQHGWRHANRAIEGRKSEYPSGLPAAILAAELNQGRDRLIALFGTRALPVFVPPWNRIAPELLPTLAESGIAALSTIASEKKPAPPAGRPAGLGLIDVHIDLTDWKDGCRFIGTAAALGALVFRLRRIRLGKLASDRAIGILTHHMVMDRETAAFLAALIKSVAGHRAARWVDIVEMLR